MSILGLIGTERMHLEVWSILDVVRVKERNLTVYDHRLLVEGAEKRTVEVDNLKGEVGNFIGMRQSQRRPGLRGDVDVVAVRAKDERLIRKGEKRRRTATAAESLLGPT